MDLSFAACHVAVLICLGVYLDLCSLPSEWSLNEASETVRKLVGLNIRHGYATTNSALAHAELVWPRLKRGQDFQLSLHENRNDLGIPVFLPSPGAIKLSEAGVPSWGEEIPLVPGAKLLHGVFTPGECDQLIVASESMGYMDHGSTAERNWRTHKSPSHDAPSPLQSMWLVDDRLNNAVFERVHTFLPPGALGLNAHWRFYRTDRGVGMARHTDGARTGSGMRNGTVVRDAFGDRLSQYSIVFYLNDDFKGGDLIFTTGVWQRQPVSVPKGGAALFPHGESSLSLLHEGDLVLLGAKYIFRTDVMFPVAGSANSGGVEPRRENLQQLNSA